MTDGPELIGGYPDVCRVWLWHQVAITSWVGRPSAAAVRALFPISEQVLVRLGSAKLSNVHLVQSRLEMPDAATRTALVDLAQTYGSRSACIGVVIGGGGFWASALRSFVTGVRMLAPRSAELNVHPSVASVVEWLPREHEARTGVRLDATKLRQAIEHADAWLARSPAAEQSIRP